MCRPLTTATPKMIAYKVAHEEQEPLAIVWGDLTKAEAPLVRMHSSCFTGDILGSLRATVESSCTSPSK